MKKQKNLEMFEVSDKKDKWKEDTEGIIWIPCKTFLPSKPILCLVKGNFLGIGLGRLFFDRNIKKYWWHVQPWIEYFFDDYFPFEKVEYWVGLSKNFESYITPIDDLLKEKPDND